MEAIKTQRKRRTVQPICCIKLLTKGAGRSNEQEAENHPIKGKERGFNKIDRIQGEITKCLVGVNTINAHSLKSELKGDIGYFSEIQGSKRTSSRVNNGGDITTPRKPEYRTTGSDMITKIIEYRSRIAPHYYTGERIINTDAPQSRLSK